MAETLTEDLTRECLGLRQEAAGLRARVADLENRLCQVTTVLPCAGGCQRCWRPRDMAEHAGGYWCAHCLKREMEHHLSPKELGPKGEGETDATDNR